MNASCSVFLSKEILSLFDLNSDEPNAKSFLFFCFKNRNLSKTPENFGTTL
ncbi:hypothetical protein SLEP1_g14880 [Rubroshorea leprosula]|uniref:Uncharacterized protein n=1 Tax=Rubroshorea leprosula TaxID=152421 RepID=A0AAV5IRI2_9ROSI|nr:hypothetical protein SLEP1_g14880 [Rubroshorea leprosula]